MHAGTSTVNFSFYNRGTKEDWDRIASITGDSRWSWESITPFAKKLETWTPPTDGRDTTGDYTPELHGDSGPILVSLPNAPSEVHRKVIQG